MGHGGELTPQDQSQKRGDSQSEKQSGDRTLFPMTLLSPLHEWNYDQNDTNYQRSDDEGRNPEVFQGVNPDKLPGRFGDFQTQNGLIA